MKSKGVGLNNSGRQIVKTASEIRAAIKSIFGKKNIKITRAGEILVNGPIPDSVMTGWYLLGTVGDSKTEGKIWNQVDGTLNKNLAIRVG